MRFHVLRAPSASQCSALLCILTRKKVRMGGHWAVPEMLYHAKFNDKETGMKLLVEAVHGAKLQLFGAGDVRPWHEQAARVSELSTQCQALPQHRSSPGRPHMVVQLRNALSCHYLQGRCLQGESATLRESLRVSNPAKAAAALQDMYISTKP